MPRPAAEGSGGERSWNWAYSLDDFLHKPAFLRSEGLSIQQTFSLTPSLGVSGCRSLIRPDPALRAITGKEKGLVLTAIPLLGIPDA